MLNPNLPAWLAKHTTMHQRPSLHCTSMAYLGQPVCKLATQTMYLALHATVFTVLPHLVQILAHYDVHCGLRRGAHRSRQIHTVSDFVCIHRDDFRCCKTDIQSLY